jgi:TadE-like protein
LSNRFARFRRSGTPRLRRRAGAGQSVVEFALLAPIMIVLVVAVVDLARVYTTTINIESAAREAADYGTFGSGKWDPAVYNVTPDGTLAKMKLRACVASSKLPDYVGPDDSCANPSFDCQLSGDLGASWAACDGSLGCDDEVREPPCWVKVTLTYDFHLLAPMNFQIGGATYGIPSTITIQRESIFPMTDLSLP